MRETMNLKGILAGKLLENSDEMTLGKAKSEMREFSNISAKWNADDKEWRITRKGISADKAEDMAYYTSDHSDAVSTARKMNSEKISESIALGDDVVVGRDDEDEKREGVVKVPNGPGDTIGVLIDGELEMVKDDEVQVCANESNTDEEECDDEVLEEGVMGMSAMPSLARMQQLAGIRVSESENPFAKKDDESETTSEEDNEAEDEDEAEAEAEDDAETPDDQGDAVAITVAADAVEDEFEAVEDQAEAIEAQATAIIAATPSDIDSSSEAPLAANHPATGAEVQMMSAPSPVEAFPETEEPQEAPPALEVCMKALGDLEQNLQNISVKDFADISKRLTAIQSSLFEGFAGRRPKI